MRRPVVSPLTGLAALALGASLLAAPGATAADRPLGPADAPQPAFARSTEVPAPSTSPTLAGVPTPATAPEPRGLADIRARIRALPGVTGLYEQATGEPGWRFFVVRMSQLVDHADPSAGRFETRITVLHHSTGAPVSVASYAPAYTKPGWYEATQILQSNQIVVERRFSGTSRPKVPESRLPTVLTMPQEAGDVHTVIATFKRIYTKRWISFGGYPMAYHRAYRPADVSGSLLYGVHDGVPGRPTEVKTLYKQLVPAGCRDRLVALQRYVLSHREEFAEKVDEVAETYDLTYDLLGQDEAMEHMVLDITPFVWLDNGEECAGLPRLSGVETVWKWLEQHYPLWYYHDVQLADYRGNYLAATQVGEIAPYEEAVKDLLEHPGTDIAASYIPDDVPVRVSTTASKKVHDWARTAQQTMFVRGYYNPFTYRPLRCDANGPSRTCSLQTVPGHGGDASIIHFPPKKRYELAATIRRWAGVG